MTPPPQYTPRMNRALYSDTIEHFLARDTDFILGRLTHGSTFAIETTQRDAWVEQIRILRGSVEPFRSASSKLYFEFAVPRVGKRIDVAAVGV